MSKQKIRSNSNVITTNDVFIPQYRDESYFVTPEFIYGGPFIEVKKPSPFIDTTTPINLPLQGTFRRSFAYFSLKDRLPIILTKVIDHLSKDGSTIKSACGASDEDLRQFIQSVAKLKNDLVTNKEYEPFQMDTPEAKKWNEWLANLENKKYFTNIWLFSECYVYRKLYEGCELIKGLQNFDYFEKQKNEAFNTNVEYMCVVADKLVDMWNKSEKTKRKTDFVTLLKLCLWSNKCDLSLSVGENVVLGAAAKETKEAVPQPPQPPPTPKGKGKGKGAEPPPKTTPSNDPFQMILDFKDKLLVDDTNKIADQIVNRAEKMGKAIEGEPNGTPADAAVGAAADGEVKEDTPKIPCPAKMIIPNHVLFDIVCDNAGYELFTDLCLASFLIEQNIVQKVRFHVKKLPWFISDVTPKDFTYTINACMNANFQKEFPKEEKPETTTEDGKDLKAEEAPPKTITSDNLRAVGAKFKSMVDDGFFVVMAEDYWTYPHPYCDMKKYDYNLYRKLQYAIAVMFKGDLNYRKLLAEKNVNPYTGFESCLQGFIPAPIIAVRTVKAELICGLPKSKPKKGKPPPMGKYEQLQQLDEHWMQKGDYGLIQFCAKAEPLKASDRPCLDYGDDCRGTACPEHTQDM